MKSWIVLLITGFGAWYLTDVSSSSPLQTLVAPLLLTAIVIIAICKVMAALLKKDSRGDTSGNGSDVGFGGSNDFDGDGGGGGD